MIFIYLAVGLISIYAENSNYDLHVEGSEFDSRVKRDIQNTIIEKTVNNENILNYIKNDFVREKRADTKNINTNLNVTRYNYGNNGKYNDTSKGYNLNGITQNNGNLSRNNTWTNITRYNYTSNHGTNSSGINGNRFTGFATVANRTITGVTGYKNITANRTITGYPGYKNITVNRTITGYPGYKNITANSNATKNSNVQYPRLNEYNYGGYNVSRPGYIRGNNVTYNSGIGFNTSKPGYNHLPKLSLPNRPVNYTASNNTFALRCILNIPPASNTTGYKINQAKNTGYFAPNRTDAVNDNTKNITLPGYNYINGKRVNNVTGTAVEDIISKKKATDSGCILVNSSCPDGMVRIGEVCVPDDFTDEDDY